MCPVFTLYFPTIAWAVAHLSRFCATSEHVCADTEVVQNLKTCATAQHAQHHANPLLQPECLQHRQRSVDNSCLRLVCLFHQPFSNLQIFGCMLLRNNNMQSISSSDLKACLHHATSKAGHAGAYTPTATANGATSLLCRQLSL